MASDIPSILERCIGGYTVTNDPARIDRPASMPS
jgi:hypothetical protein